MATSPITRQRQPPILSEVRTIASEMEHFLGELKRKHGLSQNTITSYRCDLRTAAAMLSTALDKMVVDDVQSFLEGRAEQPGTTNRRIASLGRFFRWAVEQGYASHNPIDQISARQHAQHRPQPIYNEAERRSLDSAIASVGQPYRLIFTMLREIGVRTDEVLNLNVGDVILESGREVLLVRDSKNGDKRMVVLTPDAMPRSLRGLRSWLREMSADELLPTTPLFRSSRGRRASYDTLHRRWVQLCKDANLVDLVDGREVPRYTLHHLRHTAAAELIASYPEQVVRRILGHRDPRSTRRYVDIVRGKA
jgi:integrase/recombinase XerD